jgi:hypothetical protein
MLAHLPELCGGCRNVDPEHACGTLFKSDCAGRTLMYPNGAMGRGYVVPDAATEQRMRRTLMWLIVGSGLFGGIGMHAMMTLYGNIDVWTAQTWTIGIGALVAFGIGYQLVAKSLARGMMPAEQRMGMVEALKRQSEAMPRWYLWFIAVFAPSMVAGSVMWMISEASLWGCALCLVGMGLFGAITVQAVHGLKHRARVRREPPALLSPPRS